MNRDVPILYAELVKAEKDLRETAYSMADHNEKLRLLRKEYYSIEHKIISLKDRIGAFARMEAEGCELD